MEPEELAIRNAMKAHLTLSENGNLIAKLETGERILCSDALKMAEQLRLASVTADKLDATNWKTDTEQVVKLGD